MRSAGADLIDIGRGLDDNEWQTPSAATGGDGDAAGDFLDAINLI